MPDGIRVHNWQGIQFILCISLTLELNAADESVNDNGDEMPLGCGQLRNLIEMASFRTSQADPTSQNQMAFLAL
ncbi:MAG: hypothetical protein ABIM50_01490 [Novosphingobium sp.]